MTPLRSKNRLRKPGFVSSQGGGWVEIGTKAKTNTAKQNKTKSVSGQRGGGSRPFCPQAQKKNKKKRSLSTNNILSTFFIPSVMVRFMVTFLAVFDIILVSKMLPKRHHNDPQPPQGHSQGDTGTPQGATKVPRSAPGTYF